MVGIWAHSCQAQSACGRGVPRRQSARQRHPRRADRPQVWLCRLHLASSREAVWEVCPGVWYPHVGQECGVERWHPGALGWGRASHTVVSDSGRRETPELPQSPKPWVGLTSRLKSSSVSSGFRAGVSVCVYLCIFLRMNSSPVFFFASRLGVAR